MARELAPVLDYQDYRNFQAGVEMARLCGVWGSTELAATLFHATQTEEKPKRDGVRTKAKANETHLEVGRKVRATIRDLGGTMPERLPTPDKSVGQLEGAKAKILKSKDDDR